MLSMDSENPPGQPGDDPDHPDSPHPKADLVENLGNNSNEQCKVRRAAPQGRDSITSNSTSSSNAAPSKSEHRFNPTDQVIVQNTPPVMKSSAGQNTRGQSSELVSPLTPESSFSDLVRQQHHRQKQPSNAINRNGI